MIATLPAPRSKGSFQFMVRCLIARRIADAVADALLEPVVAQFAMAEPRQVRILSLCAGAATVNDARRLAGPCLRRPLHLEWMEAARVEH